MQKKSVAILGATGLVGQKIITLLAQDEIFTIKELIASPDKAGKIYEDVVQWSLKTPCPSHINTLPISKIADIKSSYVLSALPTVQAEKSEKDLAQKGHHIFSNASAHRMDIDVPLLIHDINLESLHHISKQKTQGKIITNPNCVVSIVSGALAPLQKLGILKGIHMVTLQSASGAGYPGVPSMSLLDNTLPNILGEEEKIRMELHKMFPEMTPNLHVQVNRVPVRYGHTISLHLTYEDPIHVEKVQEAFADSPIYKVHEHPMHPQPQDLTDDDMRIHLGRIHQNPNTPNHIQLVVLGHNLVRGAAGAAIGNMHAFVRHYG